MNKVLLIGRLGADPVVNYTGDGGMVANMRLATDESYKNNAGEKVKRTEWHRIVAFGKLAEVANDYMSKGRLVCVEGSNRTRKWTDENSVDHYTTEIRAASIKLLDSRRETDDSTTATDAAPKTMTPDVPF